MTIAEIKRTEESYKRRRKIELQEKASFDYTLAQLIAINVSKVLNSDSVTVPELQAVYPALFDTKEMEEDKQKKLDEISMIRFKQFALAHNARKQEVDK